MWGQGSSLPDEEGRAWARTALSGTRRMEMRLKAFECKACGALVFVGPREMRAPSCPICRAGTEKIEGAKQNNLAEHKCPECGYHFYVPQGSSPYKCANCNFTFVTTPKKRGEERL